MGEYLFSEDEGVETPYPYRHVIFLRHPSFKQQSCFRTMAIIAFFECTTSLGYIGLGVFTTTLDTFNYYVENMVCALFDASKYGINLSTVLLAFNRFSVMCNLSLFTQKCYTVVQVLIICYCISFYCLIFTRHNSYYFFYDLGMMGANTFYPDKNPYPGIFVNITRYTSISCVGISCFFYVATILAVFVQKKRSSMQKIILPVELRLLLTAIVTFLVSAVDVLNTYYLLGLFDLRSIQIITLMLLGQCVFAFTNTAFYYALNREFRKAIHMKTSTKSSTVVTIL
uniref:7TM_GPCR_Srx domain-containing protein n=1 Tax=Steinernema glaseri TaxID=37863 RepID=A0A1I7YF49_9BILA